MRNICLLFTATLILGSGSAIAQDETFEKNYTPIKKSLNEWDPVRGAWLSEALPAVINQEPIPVRTFPENITPVQMLSLVPEGTRTEISSTAQNLSTTEDGAFWSDMNTLVSSAGCTRSQGRSYGDPHLVSFDGERFSFQTVGEFVLAKAGNSRMEVQTRQRPVEDDFSLNTAVAMNVNGDRVCLYARDFPDNFRGTPLRVNGQPVDVDGGHYFLPNGGVVTRSGRTYTIDWPTGESVVARSGVSGGMPFYNVTVNIVNCSDTQFSGVLGNADGIGRNDFDGDAWQTPGGIFASNDPNWEHTRSVFVARDFADQHRVTQSNSLFDYAPGQSTFTFTDRSYPRVVRSVNDIDPTQRARARRQCEEAGILAADMNGCIYDNAYLNITPCPPAPVREPIDPRTVKPVTPVVNTNPEPPVRQPIRQAGGTRGTTSPVKGGVKEIDVRDENTNVAVPRGSDKDDEDVKKDSNRFRWGSSEESEPVRSTPTRSTPTRSTPTISTPTRSTPTRTTPTRTTPTRSTPTRSTPTRSTPTRSTPTRSGGGRGGR